MANSATYSVPFRRRLQGRTDYELRGALIRSGQARVVVRSTNRYIYVQLVTAFPEGDVVKASGSSKELSSLGWKGGTSNLPAAYLTGVLAGKRAVARGLTRSVLDLGLRSSTKGSRLYAALKGVLDGGVAVPSSEEVLPSNNRLSGAHIADYAKAASAQGSDVYKKQFNDYLKRGLRPEELPGHFEQVKDKIRSLGGADLN